MIKTFRIFYTALLCALVFMFLSLTYCYGTNYYVEITGNTTNDGLSQLSAWPTITRALQRSTKDDLITVGIGNFTSEWIYVDKELTIIGSDLYNASKPPLSRHTSRTIVGYTPPTNIQQSSLMEIGTNNVTIRNITFDGHSDSNVASAIYTKHGSINIEYCTIQNIKNGYGILCKTTNSEPFPDSMRNNLRYNLVQNITETNATGMYFEHAPFTCANNEFSTVTGAQALAAIYVYKCRLTNSATDWISVDSNYFYNCIQGIWANNFGDTNQNINIRNNTIHYSLVGIRVTAADGQANIKNNTIYVGGNSTSTNATPARGVWVQADTDPWGALPTDHQIINNYISDYSQSTGTVGVLLEYDTTTWSNINDGVNATVLSNTVTRFDLGLYVQSGTNEVHFTNDPLVIVTANYNDFTDIRSWVIYSDGLTNTMDATYNWFGSYVNPTGTVYGLVNISNYYTGGSFLTDIDGDGTNDYLDADDDGDTLLDTNEAAIGTSPTRADTDSDGQNDWAEYIVTGTDPTNYYSVFKLTMSTTNTPEYFEFTWQGVSNRIYDVYRSTNLLEALGAPLSNNIAATPPTNTFIDTTATNLSQFFYIVTVTNM